MMYVHAEMRLKFKGRALVNRLGQGGDLVNRPHPRAVAVNVEAARHRPHLQGPNRFLNRVEDLLVRDERVAVRDHRDRQPGVRADDGQPSRNFCVGILLPGEDRLQRNREVGGMAAGDGLIEMAREIDGAPGHA
jgi:hypothetical protein